MTSRRAHPRPSVKLTSVSEIIGVDHQILDGLGAFDAVLGTDSKLFVDPLAVGRAYHLGLKAARDEPLRLALRSAIGLNITWKILISGKNCTRT